MQPNLKKKKRRMQQKQRRSILLGLKRVLVLFLKHNLRILVKSDHDHQT